MPVALFTVHCYFLGRINANIYIVIQAAKVNGRGYNLSNLTCITYQTFPRQRIFEVDFCFIFRSKGFQIGTFHRLIYLEHPTKSQDLVIIFHQPTITNSPSSMAIFTITQKSWIRRFRLSLFICDNDNKEAERLLSLPAWPT